MKLEMDIVVEADTKTNADKVMGMDVETKCIFTVAALCWGGWWDGLWWWGGLSNSTEAAMGLGIA